MSELTEFDVSETIYPVCPHCGCEQDQPWEYELEEYFTDSYECCNCNGAMLIKRNLSVTYTTAIAKAEGHKEEKITDNYVHLEDDETVCDHCFRKESNCMCSDCDIDADFGDK